MKKLIISFAAVILLLLCCLGCRSCTTSDSLPWVSSRHPRSIVILHDNDVHCAANGYLPFAGYRDAIVKADTSYVLVVSSGDFVQGGSIGSCSKGKYIIDLMNAVGYDVVTLGNHEFDYGVDRMFELTQMLKADVVSANFTKVGSDEPFFAPYVIKEAGSSRIAFIGALTPGTVYSEAYAFFNKEGKPLYDLKEDRIAEVLQQSVDKARAEGADYVILLSHLGELPVLSEVCSRKVVSMLHGVDAVLDGHTHNLIPEEWVEDASGKQVLLTQTGTKFSHIGQLNISTEGGLHSFCHPMEQFKNYGTTKVYNVMQHIAKEISSTMSQTITMSDFPLVINDENGNRLVRSQETNLGDIVADAFRYSVGAQIGLANGGGIRTDIPAGVISYMMANDVLPFGNQMCQIQATGQQLADLLEWTSRTLPYESGGFLQVSGLRYTIDCGIANNLTIDESFNLVVEGQRRISQIEVMDQNNNYVPIDLNAVYTVATISYIADTTEAFPMLHSCVHLQDDLMSDLEAFIQFLSMLGEKVPESYREPQGRIKIKG